MSKKHSINWESNTFNPFPVDTNVFDIRYGWGIVTEIKFLDKYPVKVKFESCVCAYTFDGKHRFSDKKAMLFRHEVKFEKA